MLTENQKRAVAMLYGGARVQDTAKALGVHRTTIWRWENTRDFRKEWKRIDRNTRRRFERWTAKKEAERAAYWDQRRIETEQRLQELTQKIRTRPGKAWYKAWNDYEKALCRGKTLAQLTEDIFGGKRKRHKGRSL